MNSKEKSKHRRSKYFRSLVEEIKQERGKRCQICNTYKSKGLHPHHLDESTYGQETKEDLILLCPTCHKTIEWLLSKTKNPVNIHTFCTNLTDIYMRSNGK